ncbi:hypothetical protein Glove_262g41 [Diversispora epigaea]|uniref:Piwi domain-containing protein n=1 Tax=Diversispora epigaea TaxID=1348612 RepID=A0A397IBF4_9GLOM|nr:hypothetical protein Glove_262g41 [Diversispora epigaea]
MTTFINLFNNIIVNFEKRFNQLNINEDVGPRIAERTSYGKQGHVVKLRSNYFKVSKFPNVIVSHYSFESTPKANKATIAQIYNQVAEDNRFEIYHAVYDGNSAIYSAISLPLESERKGNQFKVTLKRSRSGTIKVGTYEATIRFVQRLNFIELKKHIFGGNASMSEVLTSLAALNAYINFSVRQKYLAIGKGVYPVDTRGKPTILPGGLELKQGFYQSLRPGTECLTINVDICASVFYIGGNVLDVACKVLGKKSRDEFHRVLTSLAALNAYINFSVRQKYLAIGKGVYPVDTRGKPTILPGGLELKQGFYQSLRPGTECLTINVDICASVFYIGGNVLDVACKVLGKKSRDEFHRGMNEYEKKIMLKYLKRIKIRAIHRGQKNPVYRARGITTESADRLLFSFDKENRKITVAEYFYCTYGRKLEFETLPCIIVNKDVLMPMEVCEILEGQRFNGALADATLADMIRYTCIKPKERFNRISFSTKEIFQYNSDSLLKSIGMDVEPQNMLVNGRILPPPALEYHQKSSNARFVPEAGRWNITNKMLTQGKTLQNWSVIVFSTEKANQKSVIKRFIQQFREVASQKGMNVSNDPEIYYANPSGDIQKSLYQACCLARRFNKALPPQIVFCILEQSGPLYGEIKRIGDTIMGVPTQIILAKLLTKRGVDQICSNIALKVNVKLGGQNCFLANGQLDFVSEAPTMIFGADVFHAGRGENQPSVAAVCASMDIKATEYCGRYSKNKEPRNETIENLQEMTNNLLHAFYIRNNTLPDRILFYRDGVSEGQFEHVLRIEVKALKAVFESIYRKGFEPKLTFVVVQKRHHTRFMPNESRDGDRNGNCRPGTVVDSTIVVSQEFDFYLMSHSVLQGTGRPIHYTVIYDENDFTADGIQTLTYKLSYLSARCTLSISLVPPVYYAHLMANRARYYLQWGDSKTDGSDNSSCSISDVKSELVNTMYFV